MGNKQELLVTVRQPDGKDGSTDVALTTDVAAAVVLHWGVKKGRSGDWLLPESELMPQGSQVIIRPLQSLHLAWVCYILHALCVHLHTM